MAHAGVYAWILLVCVFVLVRTENTCIGTGCFCTKYPITVRCVNSLVQYIPERIKQLAIEVEIIGKNMKVLSNVNLDEWLSVKKLVISIPGKSVCKWISDHAVRYLRLKIVSLVQKCTRSDFISVTPARMATTRKKKTKPYPYTVTPKPTDATTMDITFKTRKPFPNFSPVTYQTTAVMNDTITRSTNGSAPDDMFILNIEQEPLLMLLFIPVGLFGIASVIVIFRYVVFLSFYITEFSMIIVNSCYSPS